MEDLKKLQEMAKNGEISKKLLGDEDFKSKLKKILKEEKDYNEINPTNHKNYDDDKFSKTISFTTPVIISSTVINTKESNNNNKNLITSDLIWLDLLNIF